MKSQRGLVYGSVCSGIEAATMAWHPLGWRPAFFSEVDKAVCRVLAHHYPHVPNLGDMTKFKEWPDHAIDILVGGTPCQSFSVAGLRKGLDDPRGNLMLTYLAIAARYRPRWLVWENVPGVLSSNKGRDFGTFLAGLAECGYGFAYRVLDAQYVRVESHPRAVPQRRRRVFVVGCLGDWRRAAAVLFERESLSGHSPPRREAGKGFARGIEIGPSGGGFTDVNPTLDCRAKDGPIRNQLAGAVICADVANTLNAHLGEKQGLEDQHINSGAPLFVAHTLKARGFDASEDGTGRGTPIVPVAFDSKGSQVQTSVTGSTPTLRSMSHDRSHQNGGGCLAIAIQDAAPCVATPWAVRRLTPRECERLQGFPDDYTLLAGSAKPQADGPRYKQLGNSMAVNVMRWIGERIAMAEDLNPQHTQEESDGRKVY